MTNLDNVGELVLKRSDRKEIDQEFSNYSGDYLKTHEYARIIYVEKPRFCFVHGYLLSHDDLIEEENSEVGERNDFRDFLTKWNPQGFADLQLIMAFFYRRTLAMEVLNQHPLKDPVLDSILADSKGHLVWVYQLQRLIGLFEPDFRRIPELAKSIRHQKDEGWDWAASQHFEDGRSLKEIIKERVTDVWIQQPLTIASYRLYNALFK